MPKCITMDSENNVMYWSNNNTDQTSLVRVNLDGSNVEVISSGFSPSFYVAITLAQPSNDVLYWDDYQENKIGIMDVNGINKRTLVEFEGNPRPKGIQVDAHKIYFGNWDGKTIQSVERDSGTTLTTLFNSTGQIRHLALVSVPA